MKKLMFSNVLGEIFPSLFNVTVSTTVVTTLMKKIVIKVTYVESFNIASGS